MTFSSTVSFHKKNEWHQFIVDLCVSKCLQLER